jgi:hypothetical protein
MTTTLQDIALQLTELSSIVKDFKVNLPRIIKSELDKRHNQRKAVVYGLGENNNYNVIYDIFKAYGIGFREIKILHRLGRASLERAGSRPLVIQFTENVMFPHLITLANIIKNNATWSHIKVRKYETAEERHQGFLKREERRKIAAKVLPPTTENVVIPRNPPVTKSKCCKRIPAEKAKSSKTEKTSNTKDSGPVEKEQRSTVEKDHLKAQALLEKWSKARKREKKDDDDCKQQ